MKRTIALLLALAVAVAVAACGGSSADDRSPKEALSSAKPLSSAQTAVALRMFFDDAPASVGDKLELTFDGPLRNNGPDKLASFDWKVAFTGLDSNFSSRIVSTGDNFFVNLGGQDFEAGQEAVQRLTDQAAASRQKGLAQVGLNPLAAVKNVKEAGDRKFDGETLTVYKGDIDVDSVLDQIERLSQGLPTTGAAQALPQGRLTAEQRGRVKRMFAQPRFEVGMADDDTIRQVLITSKFTTPPANREAAGGISGGWMEYKVEYTGVGDDVTITAPSNPQPLSDFFRELQSLLAKRGG
jgi:hypothetical protein